MRVSGLRQSAEEAGRDERSRHSGQLKTGASTIEFDVPKRACSSVPATSMMHLGTSFLGHDSCGEWRRTGSAGSAGETCTNDIEGRD